jgi:hypothetical protein
LRHWREEFRPIAERYRFHGRIIKSAGCGFFLSIGSTAVLASIVPGWLSVTYFLIPVLTFWSIAVLAILSAPELVCPACAGRLTAIRRYCPECGCESFQRDSFWGGLQCAGCHKTLRSGKHRNYRIKACTRCGVMLDEQGL